MKLRELNVKCYDNSCPIININTKSATYFDIEDVYNCKVSGRIIKETQVTEVPFRCTYVGNNVGMIDPSK